jgi:LysR family hydrogen peroxide-inducible transcriptional activator
MNLRSMRYLIALAQCLNFSRAAERCAVTQPTLSIQVRKLEEYLGVVLFERDCARVTLTAEGRDVLQLAQVMVAAADNIIAFSRARARAARASKSDLYLERTSGTAIEDINCGRASHT